MQKTIIFFGDKSSATKPASDNWKPDITAEPFPTLVRTHKLKALVFPYQVHGTEGLVIDAQNFNEAQSFVHDADWIITNVPDVGLGILTADCVPILVHDPVNGAIGAIHAGWRGAVDGIIIKALGAMTTQFGSQPSDMHIFIGPHARTCCYKVDQQFYDTVVQKPYGKNSWYDNGSNLFFDLYHCCVEQLKKVGVPHHAITDSGICTVCTPTYCSYRREKDLALRNISLIMLKKNL